MPENNNEQDVQQPQAQPEPNFDVTSPQVVMLMDSVGCKSNNNGHEILNEKG
jgi:hypothetical protein